MLLTLQGSTRQLAFVQFHGIPDAKAFLEKNYPSVTLHTDPSRTTEGIQVRVAFSREKVDRPLPGKVDGDWKCPCVCFYALAVVISDSKELLVLKYELLTPIVVLSVQCC